MENKLSKFITGFRKLHGIQHSMVTMLEKWSKDLDKKIFLRLIYAPIKGL